MSFSNNEKLFLYSILISTFSLKKLGILVLIERVGKEKERERVRGVVVMFKVKIKIKLSIG